MPIIKSATKRAKQAEKRRERNIETKRSIKTATKAFLADPSAETLATAQSELDKAVKKGLLKKNTVARRKQRLSRIAKEEGVKLKTAPKKTATKEVPKKAIKKDTTKQPTKKAPAKKTTK